MRHRFHSMCPYFAMFPETFVEKHLEASPYNGVVFDPFSGRGTTVFQALLQSRNAAACDIHPVAVCVSAAKSDPPDFQAAQTRLTELRQACHEPNDGNWSGAIGEFFTLCFHPETLRQVRYLRSVLDWRHRQDDRFIAALCLGSLHGESHRSPNYFSNRMARTISTKPAYSVRWWRRRGCTPPRRDVFDILERRLTYRFRTPPAEKRGRVVRADARQASEAFPKLRGRVTDVITSPPYLDTTNYREDQWLRLWFLGAAPAPHYPVGDDRHGSKDAYWAFLEQSWKGLRDLLAERARLVIRIGGRRLQKVEVQDELARTLSVGLERDIRPVDSGVTSVIVKTQANTFRGAKVSPRVEHDFCFVV